MTAARFISERAVRNLATAGRGVRRRPRLRGFQWHPRRRRWRSSRCRCTGGVPRQRSPGINGKHHVAGGIAIAIGAMVDAAIVMIENAHKKIEAGSTPIRAARARRQRALGGDDAGCGRGPARLLLPPLVITPSFVPVVHALQAQEWGRLFGPGLGARYLGHGCGGWTVGDAAIPVLMGVLDPRPHS